MMITLRNGSKATLKSNGGEGGYTVLEGWRYLGTVVIENGEVLHTLGALIGRGEYDRMAAELLNG